MIAATTEDLEPFINDWNSRSERLIGAAIDVTRVSFTLRSLWDSVFQAPPERIEIVSSPHAAAEYISRVQPRPRRIRTEQWVRPLVPAGLLGEGNPAFEATLATWTTLTRQQSRLFDEVHQQMQWSVGSHFGVLDDWNPVYDWMLQTHPDQAAPGQRELVNVSRHLGWFWTFDNSALLCQPPTRADSTDGNRTIQFRDGWIARS